MIKGLPTNGGHPLAPEQLRALAARVAARPELWRLGQYAVTDDGALRRVSVSYADELRPLDAAAA